MNNKVAQFLVVTMMASWLAGCSQNNTPQASPDNSHPGPLTDKTPGPVTNTTPGQVADNARGRSETLDDQADQGKQLGTFRNGRPQDTYNRTDLSNASQTMRARSAHGMAYELEALSAVKGCAVVVVNRVAYVGVRPATGYTLDEGTETEIRVKIHKMDLNQNIQAIHVTAEPRAVEFLSAYSDALEKGRPLTTYEQEFQTMVRQTWPNGQE
jgi:hypothetical protein